MVANISVHNIAVVTRFFAISSLAKFSASKRQQNLWEEPNEPFYCFDGCRDCRYCHCHRPGFGRTRKNPHRLGGEGIGGKLLVAQRFADSPGVFAGNVEIALSGAIIIKSLEYVRRRLLAWHPEMLALTA